MALQFYAVHSDALAFTHDALQAHANAHGLRAPGPTRALRIAQLYGHIQLRAAGRPVVSLAVCELASCWRLQPRQLRQDLALLQELGWLTATGTSRGTVIALHPPEASSDVRVVQATIPHLTLAGSLSRRQAPRAARATDHAEAGPVSRQSVLPVGEAFGDAERLESEPAGDRNNPATRVEPPIAQEPRQMSPGASARRLNGASAGAGAAGAKEPSEGLLDAIDGGDDQPRRQRPEECLPDGLPSVEESTPGHTAAIRAVPVSTATESAPSDGPSIRKSEPELLSHLADLYNQHRPPSWPAYHPRGQGLRTKVRQALKQAGGPDALATTLIAALNAMPPFWRHTYPQGRSGAECMAVLFATDRGCAGLGVEFWHLFSWAQAGSPAGRNGASGGAVVGVAGGAARSASAADGAPVTPSQPEHPLQRARRLFLWDSGVWRGQGREALLLSVQEKRELTLLLEAEGVGLAGTAARQFAPPDELVAATEAEGSGDGEAQVCGRGEETASVAVAPPGASGHPKATPRRRSLQGGPPDGASARKQKPLHQQPLAGAGSGQAPEPDANPSSKPQPIRRCTKRLQAVQPKRPLPPPAAGPPAGALRRRPAPRHLQGSPLAVTARAG
jgi:hypothetical protein